MRQLLAARGVLTPGMITFKVPEGRFVFMRPLVAGMTPEMAFWAAMNSRSSMCDKKLGTPKAGYLTRRLVFLLWAFKVSMHDCLSAVESRSVLTCRVDSGCCARCYGLLPDGQWPKVGFPAGLIAAQSIGERGTQLSMQSFHTSDKAISMEDVEHVLSGKGHDVFMKDDGAAAFRELMKSSRAYRGLLDRHFHILWRIIHASPERNLRSALSSLGLFSGIAFERQAQRIFLAALYGKTGSIKEPAAKIMFNLFHASEPQQEV